MHRTLIVQLFGIMCQNRPENGSYFFSQIHSELHSQTFRHLVKGGYNDSGGVSNTQPILGQGGPHIFAEKTITSPEAISQELTPVSEVCCTPPQ